jgi:hypothetical protein
MRACAPSLTGIGAQTILGRISALLQASGLHQYSRIGILRWSINQLFPFQYCLPHSLPKALSIPFAG